MEAPVIMGNCFGILKTQNSLNNCENPAYLANKFNEYYTSVGPTTASKATSLASKYNLELNFNISLQEELIDNRDEFKFQSVQEKDVKQVIKGFSSNKAPGYDRITSRILKDSMPCILSTVTQLMNNSFTTDSFASVWKIAKVTPILKTTHNIEDPENSRPISLLPILSKVSERLAHTQLSNYLTTHELLAQNQSGNKKLHSTETALLYVTDEMLKAMDERKITALVLLDMSKAFDSVCHEILLRKLQSLKVSSHSLTWFNSYLSGRYQRVRIQDAISDLRELKYGVPQGSILGP